MILTADSSKWHNEMWMSPDRIIVIGNIEWDICKESVNQWSMLLPFSFGKDLDQIIETLLQWI